MGAKIEPIALPQGSRASGALARVDFSDAFGAHVATGGPQTARELAERFFRVRVGWVGALMALRDRIVRPLGLKGSAGGSAQPKIEPGVRAGPFRILACEPDEILLGNDDRHLDFRVGLRVDPRDTERVASISTVVQFHNAFGRLYFTLIKPFHRRIVKAMLAAALAEPQSSATARTL